MRVPSIPFVLCLHLLATTVPLSTTEAPQSETETTTSPDLSSTKTEPPQSSLSTTKNDKQKTTGQAAFTNLDNTIERSSIGTGTIPNAVSSTMPMTIVTTHNTPMLTDNYKGNYTNTQSESNTTPSNSDTTILLNNTTHKKSFRNNQTASNFNTTVLLSNKTADRNCSSEHNAHPKCKDGNARSNRLVCFISLWALGVTASVFMGLTIYLWVRLSVQRARERKARGRQGQRKAGSDLENLWVDQRQSVEDRVEFWYANGTTMGPDNGGRERRKERRREQEKKNGRGRECENLWTQPKVTLEDISDFWYSNRRGIPKETVV